MGEPSGRRRSVGGRGPAVPERFLTAVSDARIRREKAKARDLRRSSWWKQKIATGRCHYCGRQVSARELTMDHVVPLVRGGRSTKGNVVPACKQCNASKKHHLAFEWEPGG